MINAEDTRLLSRRVHNDETELLELIADVLEISHDALRAVDLNHDGAALLTGLLANHQQPVVPHRPACASSLGRLPRGGKD